MVAHRYWRVRMVPQSGNYAGCGELEFRETIGGPDVVGGGTAFASTIYSGTYSAARAYDGNVSTYWCSTNSAQNWFIGYDFGAGNEKDIHEIAWTGNTYSNAYSPKQINVEWSDDNATWTELFNITGIPAWTSGLQRVYNDIPPPPGGNAQVAGAILEPHLAGETKARLPHISLETHLAGETKARLAGVWLEAHTSLTTLTQALMSGVYLEVHASLRERPIRMLPYTPDGKVTETITWMTDILQNYDGTDQRIAVRPRPRRSLTYDLSILTDAERKAVYDFYYYSTVNPCYAPAYHEQAYLKNKALTGQSTLSLHVRRAALRDGAAIHVAAPQGAGDVYRVQTHTPQTVKINRPLGFDVQKGAWITPVYVARIAGIPSIGMGPIAGSSTLTLDVQEYRDEEAWPDEPVFLDTFDDYPVLTMRPFGFDADEGFDAGINVTDNETGIRVYDTAWDQRYVGGSRQYLVNRQFNLDAMQWWRTFMDWCCGQQRPFLASTWRKDQVAVGTLVKTGIVLAGLTFASLYRDSPTYSRLEIETEDGDVYWVSIASASPSGLNTTITFVDELPDAATGAVVKRVSYLLLSRLGSDTVTLTHEGTFSMVNLSLRTVKE